MHFNSSQSRSAWTEQEDDLLRNAVGIYGERSWANVAQMVPGRSSKSCSDRWRNFLSPDIEHPRKSPFTEWEIAVVVLAQTRYGNNWKAISLLLPGRTNRAVKNLFVGNLKWGARLPEIRNRFLEWGMSLESLLEIKPDRAGGPIKPRPGQALPEGVNTMSHDGGSHLSGSPASTSSAGSAWQSDMTEHPNGSPGSAHTSERRRRADGEMAAATAGQQSSPVTKRRRGAQNGGGSPVLGGLQHQLQSPCLTPHPGALGPSFASGVGGTGSPQLGLTLQGTMGPPANRAPSYLPTDHHPSTLAMSKQQGGLNSSDGTSALAALHTGSEATPTSDLGSLEEGCATLTPGGALTVGLAGGCFSASAAALGLMQQPGGPRTNSMPCGGLQQLLMSGDDCMAGRVASWHYPGQMFAAAGSGMQQMDPAAAAAMAARSASPFQQHAVQVTAVAAAGIPGSLTSLLTDGSDTGAAAVAMGSSCGQQGLQEESINPGAAAAAATTYQLQQQHQHWLHQQHYQQQQMLHHTHQQHMHHMHHMHQQHHHQQQQMAVMHPERDLAAAAAMAATCDMAAMQAVPGMQQMPHGAQQDATTAGIVASVAMRLSLPGSPGLTGSILQDMRSNDSAGLHSMLDQILNEDLNMADSTLALLGGSDGIPGSIAPQRSLAFDPPVISIPSPPAVPHCQAGGNAPSPSPNPHAPPPTPVGGVAPAGLGVMGMLGQAGTCSSMHAAAAADGSREGAWGPSRLSNMSHGHVNTQSASEAFEGYEGGAVRPSMQSPRPVSIKSDPFMQADVQMQRVASMSGPCVTPQRQSSQQLPQYQHQEQQEGSAGMPTRPGSSTGTASQAAAMQAQSPEPTPGHDMTAMCAHLQEQNQLLMFRLHEMEKLQQRREKEPGGGNASEAHAGVLAMVAGAEAAAAGMAAGPDTPAAAVRAVTPSSDHALPAQGSSATSAAAAAAVAASFLGFDHMMPQLRPVITRVGGSAGGLLCGSLGGMCPELAAVAESPAQLINTAFLDAHSLLDGL